MLVKTPNHLFILHSTDISDILKIVFLCTVSLNGFDTKIM